MEQKVIIKLWPKDSYHFLQNYSREEGRREGGRENMVDLGSKMVFNIPPCNNSQISNKIPMKTQQMITLLNIK